MNTRKALFLDRDGIINVDKGYVHKIDEFEFVDGIFELCMLFQANGYHLIIVTNQSGIAKKYYTKKDFNNVTNWMIQKFRGRGIEISKVYFCPHENCERRKPNPGMLLDAYREFNLNLKECVLIGDKESDIKAAKNAGLRKYFLVKSNAKIDLRQICSSVNLKITI